MAYGRTLIDELHNEKTRRSAFERLVKGYSPKMYMQIRRLVTDHDDADDVLQNAWIKAWNGIGNFRGESQISTWLCRIAINEAITFIGRQKTMTSLDAPMAGATDDDEEKLTVASRLAADSYFDGTEAEAKLQEAIAMLPPKQRAVFNMKYYDDIKYEEMSEIMETSVGALKASYHHAVKKITAWLEE